MHPEEEFDIGQTVVWTPAFQGAWDAMNGHFGAEEAKVLPPNELIAKLNSFDWDSKTVMPEERWKAWAAEATQEFLDSANGEAVKILGGGEGGGRG